MQNWRDSGDECMRDRMDAGDEGCRRDSGGEDAGHRRDLGDDLCRTGGMQAIRDSG